MIRRVSLDSRTRHGVALGTGCLIDSVGGDQVNKTISMVGALLVGGAVALVLRLSFFHRRQRMPATNGLAKHCRVVSVIFVGGVAQIQPITDDTFTVADSLTWEMDIATVDAGYIFPADGINFHPVPFPGGNKAGHEAPAAEFSDCWTMPKNVANPTKFKCKNNHATLGTWAYTVRVAVRTPPPISPPPVPPPLDPFIVNGR